MLGNLYQNELLEMTAVKAVFHKTFMSLCSRFHCFEKIPEADRRQIMENFNDMASKNEQGLIALHMIARRHPRVSNHDNSKDHAASYTYKVCLAGKDVPVCHKAFVSIHGISKHRVNRLQQSLTITGQYPKDQRGRHENRPTKIPNAVMHLIKCHINSFQARKSHYSLHDKPHRWYLPEHLTVAKMHEINCGTTSLEYTTLVMIRQRCTVTVDMRVRRDPTKVTSMLLDCINHNREDEIKELVLTSDGSSGQNKNKLPVDWDSVICNARKYPTPFSLLIMRYDFKDMKAATDPFFPKTPKPPLQLKEARVVQVVKGIKPAKANDLAKLMAYLECPANRVFYEDVICGGPVNGSSNNRGSDFEVDNADNSCGCNS
ncbi:hypothetical protein PR048_007979 [Dryococelus australis]|uniref:Uncharacterized protein n=1 Tax=Dryococelus australis TaxID=614101 RepID=A0ABQ9HXG0_9NEOP|nr:hypothetical protein PR048_007979 [Dryococelus australis]